jgi:anti-sigma factor RsiW
VIAACDDFAADLVAYLDGELGDADRARIEAHLGTCLACRRELEQFRRLRALIDGVRPLDLSADFTERMWQRLDPLPAGATRRRTRVVLWAAPALAAAAALGIVWYSSIGRLGNESTATAPRSIAAAARPHEGKEQAVASRDRAREGAAPGDVASADDVAEYPPELVDHPELFLHLPVVRRLHKLEHFEEVRQHQDEEPLGRLVPGAAEVG